MSGRGVRKVGRRLAAFGLAVVGACGVPGVAVAAPGPGVGPSPAAATHGSGPAVATDRSGPAADKGGTTQSKRQPTRLVPSQFVAATKPRKLAGSTRRHIVLHRAWLALMRGEDVLWGRHLRADGRPPRGPVSLVDVQKLVRLSPYPDWLVESEPGVFVLRAALVQAPGTKLTISRPGVREVRLLSTRRTGEEVYISGLSAKLSIVGARITSWRPTGGPDPAPSVGRPFITVDQPGSVLEVTDAQLSYLGGDATLAYGVTWGRGSTGKAIGSIFDHNFFGAYSNAAVGVAFRRNEFRDNDLYGLDPHTKSRKLVVDDNVAHGNGLHGIIFSEDVVDSVVSNNRSYNNRANGIMMDERSNRNVIVNNRVWGNTGDGIVLQDSSGMSIRGNTVTGNRVGVRVSGVSLGNNVAGNSISQNTRGVEMLSGPARATAMASPNTLADNNLDGVESGHGIVVKDFGIVVKDFAGVRVTRNTVKRFTNGVLVTGASEGARIVGNHVSEGERGIEVGAGSPGALLDSNVVNAASERGLVLAAAGTVSQNDTVAGSDIGIDARGDVSVQRAHISGGRRGMDVVLGRVQAVGVDVNAREFGIALAPGTVLDLHGSVVRAKRPVVGTAVPTTAGNHLRTPPPPFDWLAVAGAIFVVMAIGMQLAHRARSPVCYAPMIEAPQGVRNAG